MTQPKNILVATIGTRDLAFYTSSGDWLNVGNDRATDWNSATHEALVDMDLRTEPDVKGEIGKNFRSRTEYLLSHFYQYRERLQPIILGKLLSDLSAKIHKIYLIGTDQNESVSQRTKDTFFCAEILKKLIEEKYKVDTQVIPLGRKKENPSDFDAMVHWCKQEVWQPIEADAGKLQTILVSPKGGVGQSSEALRVTSLSLYGDEGKVEFYDFEEDEKANRQGKPSQYKGPYRGINYLWNLKQREARTLLEERFDYVGVWSILRSYWKDTSDPHLLMIRDLLEIARQWNQGDLPEFKRLLDKAVSRGYLNINLKQLEFWWWTAYEMAYLGEIRYRQGNTIEALFHTFRAVEGLMSEWALNTYPKDIERRDNPNNLEKSKAPLVKKSITKQPKLDKYLNEFSRQNSQELHLYGLALDNLLQMARPESTQNRDMLAFWDVAKDWRNQVFHRLLGLQQTGVFQAWKTSSKKEWLNRVLGCLNFLSNKEFPSLSQASLMSQVHETLKEAIASYQP